MSEEYEYDFAAIDADVLGSIYEEYLGFMLKKFKKKLRLLRAMPSERKWGVTTRQHTSLISL